MIFLLPASFPVNNGLAAATAKRNLSCTSPQCVALLPSGSPRASFVHISAPGRISPVLDVLRIRASPRRCPQLARRELGVDLPVFEKAPLGGRFSRHWTGGWMLESVARSDELRSSVLSR